ncbi:MULTISPECIES: hypothetical protein [Streptomyces]|uniref:hypothetical protein n=1 Tax=Streptomyces TaxID=1883 RepID=UPI0011121E20|nr:MULTISPECIES: hypothetical protein [Streptomyces]WSU72659.1 DUF4145 domain-containing protein [Streptomyces anulatus]WTD28951.1 DUF4145 domain-containing protein [Streptomyces anulatus]
MEIAKLVLEYIKVLAWPAFAAGLLWTLRGKIKEIADRLTRVETPAGSAEFAAAAANVLDDAEEVALSNRLAVGPSQLVQPVEAEGAGDSQISPATSANDPPPTADPNTSAERENGQLDPGGSRENGRERPLIYIDPQLLARMPEVLAASLLYSGGTRPASDPFSEAMDTTAVSPRAAVVEAWLTLESMCLDVLRERNIHVGERPNPLGIQLELKKLGLSTIALDVFKQLRTLRNRAVHSGEAVTKAAAEDFVHSCRAVAGELGRLPLP